MIKTYGIYKKKSSYCYLSLYYLNGFQVLSSCQITVFIEGYRIYMQTIPVYIAKRLIYLSLVNLYYP